MSIDERLVHFRKLRNTLLDELNTAVETVSSGAGKVPLDSLVSDIMPVLDFIKHLEKDASRILKPQKMKTPIVFFGKKSYVEYMPRGVTLIISPWNYPFQLAMIPILSALVSGNTVVSKPSEVTPFVGKYMEELFKKAGFPEDVISFVHGGKEAGQALIEAKPDYIFFTGSVATGKIIGKQAAEALIPVTLELGGKDPMIVCKDAHLERAAKAAVWGAFTNSGQVCMSVERLYVDESVSGSFLEQVIKETKMLKQGTGADDDIGSMTFPGQLNVVKDHVLDAIEKGAVLKTGRHPDEWDPESMFLQPMVLTNVHKEMKIMKEETFGPILPVMNFRDEEEVVEAANSTEFGLNASVWSSDMDRARKIAGKLVSGAVLINELIISVANHHLPFGGAKSSGIGSYHGETGLRIFCHEKAIMVDRGSKASEIQWYPYHGKYDTFHTLIQSFYADRVKVIPFLASYLKLLIKGK